MSVYRYVDRDNDRLVIKEGDRTANTAFISAYEGVYVPADEAPKTAQAILDAAGVKGVLLTDLPEVTKGQLGVYEADGFTSYHQSGLSWLEKEVKALVAIWLQRKADEADKLAQQIEEAETFRANQARIDANKAEKKALEAKKAHDDLRTSPIALKALAIYNRACIGYGPYASWADVNCGAGAQDHVVRKFIEYAEAAESKEKAAAEKLAARRNAVAEDYFNWNYEGLTANGKRTVRRIIELEDAK